MDKYNKLALRAASRGNYPSSRSRRRQPRKRFTRKSAHKDVSLKRSSRRSQIRKRPSRKRPPRRAVLFIAAVVAFQIILVFVLANNALRNTAEEITENTTGSINEAASTADTEKSTAVASAVNWDTASALDNFDDIYDRTSETSEPATSTESEELSAIFSEEIAEEDTPITEEEIRRCFAELYELFPEGMYWNHRGVDVADGAETCYIVTDTPCWHGKYGDVFCNRYDGATKDLFPEYSYLTQCLAYASLVSDYIFGEDAPLTVFYDYDQLKIGDHIRLTSLMHSMTVTAKTDEYVTVMEVDEDGVECQIGWGREITRQELEGYGSSVMYITRYATD